MIADLKMEFTKLELDKYKKKIKIRYPALSNRVQLELDIPIHITTMELNSYQFHKLFKKNTLIT